jgi:uncharacterized protein (DUF1810 family)
MPEPVVAGIARDRAERQPGYVTDPFDLQRFVDAQDNGWVYDSALAELRAGQKRGHWMWFVFPQLAGLGHSAMAQFYGISGLEEAKAYLAHPVLGPRLVECARTLTAHRHRDAVRVLGPVDAQKLHSSMTLFARADPQERAFRDVLHRYFGDRPDEGTTSRL